MAGPRQIDGRTDEAPCGDSALVYPSAVAGVPQPPARPLRGTMRAEQMPTVPLDPDQQAAVDHREGPCLVLAGPGSGKTRVIVERFLALVGEGLAPDHQLVLTYTVKAAAEMRDRAERVHGPFAGDV